MGRNVLLNISHTWRPLKKGCLFLVFLKEELLCVVGISGENTCSWKLKMYRRKKKVILEKSIGFHCSWFLTNSQESEDRKAVLGQNQGFSYITLSENLLLKRCKQISPQGNGNLMETGLFTYLSCLGYKDHKKKKKNSLTNTIVKNNNKKQKTTRGYLRRLPHAVIARI